VGAAPDNAQISAKHTYKIAAHRALCSLSLSVSVVAPTKYISAIFFTLGHISAAKEIKIAAANFVVDLGPGQRGLSIAPSESYATKFFTGYLVYWDLNL
jgi:hypothetical protein